MAERSRRRRNSVTRLLEDLVDDVLDRAKDLEQDTRKTARRALDDDDDRPPSNDRGDEVDRLKSALDDLTEKVNRLVALQTEGRSPSPSR